MTPSRVTNSETKILLIGVLRGDRYDSIECRAGTSQSVSSRNRRGAGRDAPPLG
jgi:hypothetical protein